MSGRMSGSLGAADVARSVSAAAGELTRIWRQVLHETGRATSPGLIDGVVPDFLERIGSAVPGGAPGRAWPETQGVVRIGPDRAATVRELELEWRALGAVLSAAAEALGGTPSAAEAVAATAVAARLDAPFVAEGRGPVGVVVVRYLKRPQG